MKNSFFNQFLFQREMYFSSCIVSKLGNYYFSELNDPIWNFFVPNSNLYLEKLDIIRKVFEAENKELCIVTDVNESKEICDIMTPFYYETWYELVKKEKYNTKYECSINHNINEIKSVMFAAFSSHNEGLQPWGELDKKYYAIINDKLSNDNITNFALKLDNHIACVCSLYEELNTYNIFNFAISPRYQNDTRVLEIFRYVINYYLDRDGQGLFIQLKTKDTLSKKMDELGFSEYLNVVYLK